MGVGRVVSWKKKVLSIFLTIKEIERVLDPVLWTEVYGTSLEQTDLLTFI